MDSQSLVERIRSDGYAILEHAIDDALVTDIKCELAPWLDRKHMGRNDFEGYHTERVYALLAKAPSIAQLIEHPVVLAVLDRLLPTNYLLSAALAINVHPGETPQRFHVDDAGGNLLKRPRQHVGVSTMWALDDFTAQNGATEVVPGSHLWEEGREPTPADAIKAVMPAGSVMLFLGNVLHRGGANESTGVRLGITPQYCAPFIRQLETMVLAVPPEIAGRYSDRIQSLLGYSVVEPGFMGYVDGLHPKRLIDSGYRGRKARGIPS